VVASLQQGEAWLAPGGSIGVDANQPHLRLASARRDLHRAAGVAAVPDGDEAWGARVTPLAGSSVATRRGISLGPAVRERQPGLLVVAVPESRLAALERRLATVDRWATLKEYAAQRPQPPTGSEA
jgi:hypothetical protein